MLFKKSIKFPNIFNLTVGNTDLDNKYVSINRCLALLLTTAKGELLGDPDFGCTLYEQLFNPYVDSKKDVIIKEIINAITKYEQRVVVNNTDISIEKSDNNDHLYFIHINYTLKNSDLTNNTVITIDKEDYRYRG